MLSNYYKVTSISKNYTQYSILSLETRAKMKIFLDCIWKLMTILTFRVLIRTKCGISIHLLFNISNNNNKNLKIIHRRGWKIPDRGGGMRPGSLLATALTKTIKVNIYYLAFDVSRWNLFIGCKNLPELSASKHLDSDKVTSYNLGQKCLLAT